MRYGAGSMGAMRLLGPMRTHRTAGVAVELAAACAALASALTGCSGPSANRPSADCAWQLHYGGRVYVPAAPARPVAPSGTVHTGKALGRGVLPGCSEGGAGTVDDQQVAVYRIPGVDPGAAVITQDDTIGATPSTRTS